MTNLPHVAFRSDTLKSNFERVFSSAGPHVVRGVSEVIRLTDWGTLPLRTGTYCVVYFTAWFFGYAMVLLGIFATVLACFPLTRRYLFPRVSTSLSSTSVLTDSSCRLLASPCPRPIRPPTPPATKAS